jgi:CheY-like chemotaxis protein
LNTGNLVKQERTFDMDKKILIVDDEKDTLSVLEKALTTEGYSVITADNGKDAIMLAKSKHPELIMLDILMPGMDGAEVAARLKEHTETKNIPVIFLTCLLSKVEEKGRKDHTINGYVFVAKPYNVEGLLAQVERLMNWQCVNR